MKRSISQNTLSCHKNMLIISASNQEKAWLQDLSHSEEEIMNVFQ
jgi:hypothetical protein